MKIRVRVGSISVENIYVKQNLEIKSAGLEILVGPYYTCIDSAKVSQIYEVRNIGFEIQVEASLLGKNIEF